MSHVDSFSQSAPGQPLAAEARRLEHYVCRLNAATESDVS